MLENIAIGPMTEDFLLWRCLHGGSLSKGTIDELPTDQVEAWEAHRAINVPLLRKVIRTYGTCAILARDGDRVVGFLRFYPKALLSLEGAGQLCLQQAFPAGPSEHLVEAGFPPLEEIEDRTLTVHCLMTGSPFQAENPYQRRRIGTRMAQKLVRWAREGGWEGIEATAFEDIDILYANMGAAGRRFWEKLGFRVVKREVQSVAGWKEEFVRTMREQALALGLRPEDAQNRYTMRIELS
jgi:GNAT superfamily N-acetyltransferase